MLGGLVFTQPLVMTAPEAASVTALQSPAASTSALAFTPRSLGSVIRTAELSQSPGGGGETLSLAPGQPLAIGGTVHVRAGLVRRTIYWVRADGPGGPRYGFVPADLLALTTPGEPPMLAYTGIAPDAFLQPVDGIQGDAASSGVGATTADNAITGLAVSDAAPAGEASLAIPWLPATVARFAPQFAAAGKSYGVDPELLAIVTLVESGGHAAAVSTSGAQGLMQIMPTTAAGIAEACTIAPFDAATSIDCGARYLASQLKRFGQLDDPDWQSTVSLAAAAYNGGPGTVDGYLNGRALPAEAQRYQRWVGGMWRERHEATSLTFKAWWDAGGYRLVQKAEAEQPPAEVALATTR